MPRYGDPIEIVLVLKPDISKKGFLRETYDEWRDDVAYYKEHPEITCDPGYLRDQSFEDFVREVAEGRVEEMLDIDPGAGFKVEARRA